MSVESVLNSEKPLVYNALILFNGKSAQLNFYNDSSIQPNFTL